MQYYASVQLMLGMVVYLVIVVETAVMALNQAVVSVSAVMDLYSTESS